MPAEARREEASVTLSAALVLLSRLDEQGPRERRELFGFWAKEDTILDAADLGWVTYERDVVALTNKGRRALDGQRRRERFGTPE